MWKFSVSNQILTQTSLKQKAQKSFFCKNLKTQVSFSPNFSLKFPDDVNILKKNSFCQSRLNLNSSCSLTNIALQFYSLINIGIDLSSVENELQYLSYTIVYISTSEHLGAVTRILVGHLVFKKSGDL